MIEKKLWVVQQIKPKSNSKVRTTHSNNQEPAKIIEKQIRVIASMIEKKL